MISRKLEVGEEGGSDKQELEVGREMWKVTSRKLEVGEEGGNDKQEAGSRKRDVESAK